MIYYNIIIYLMPADCSCYEWCKYPSVYYVPQSQTQYIYIYIVLQKTSYKERTQYIDCVKIIIIYYHTRSFRRKIFDLTVYVSIYMV